MKKILFCLALAACAPQPVPVVAPVSIEVPPAPKAQEEVPKYVPKWGIRPVQEWDMTIEVVDPTEIHYKSKSNGTIIRAASMNGKLLLTCGDSLGSINLCLETGGFIEYTCNTLSLVVSCKYVKLEIGNEHQEISNQTTEEKEKENGVRD